MWFLLFWIVFFLIVWNFQLFLKMFVTVLEERGWEDNQHFNVKLKFTYFFTVQLLLCSLFETECHSVHIWQSLYCFYSLFDVFAVELLMIFPLTFSNCFYPFFNRLYPRKKVDVRYIVYYCIIQPAYLVFIKPLYLMQVFSLWFNSTSSRWLWLIKRHCSLFIFCSWWSFIRICWFNFGTIWHQQENDKKNLFMKHDSKQNTDERNQIGS